MRALHERPVIAAFQTRLILAVIFHSVQLDGQVLGLITNGSELADHKLHLFSQLTGGWLRAEFNSLYESIVGFELLMQLVRSLYLEHVVAERYNVRDGVHFKLLGHLEERPDFPLLVLFWEKMLELGARRDHLDLGLLQDAPRRGHEPLSADLDPAFSRVRDDQRETMLDGHFKQSSGVLVDFLHLASHVGWQRHARGLLHQMLMRNDKCGR